MITLGHNLFLLPEPASQLALPALSLLAQPSPRFKRALKMPHYQDIFRNRILQCQFGCFIKNVQGHKSLC